MLFLCFSGKVRELATSILYHLENFGLKIWYDNQEYLFGENKNLKRIEAISSSNYAIIVFSKHFPSSIEAIEELEIIKNKYQDNELHVFPVFYCQDRKKIPSEYSWLNDLIYNYVDEGSGTLKACNQIVCKYYSDIVNIENIPELNFFIKKNNIPKVISKMIKTYYLVDSANLNTRITIIYSIFIFIDNIIELPNNIQRSIKYLFSNTQLNIPLNDREIQIAELILRIGLNMI